MEASSAQRDAVLEYLAAEYRRTLDGRAGVVLADAVVDDVEARRAEREAKRRRFVVRVGVALGVGVGAAVATAVIIRRRRRALARSRWRGLHLAA
jgi:hypothetical protein